MDTRERNLRSDWRIYRGGAVYFEGAEDCMLDHCILEQLGGNAVFVNNYNRRIKVQTCRLKTVGPARCLSVIPPRSVEQTAEAGRKAAIVEQPVETDRNLALTELT